MGGAQLLELYRDTLLALGADRGNRSLQAKALDMEQELLRRMAW